MLQIRYLMKNIEILKGKSQRVIGILYLTIGILCMLSISRFKTIFDEMLEGDPLPKLTQLFINTDPYLWLFLGYIPGCVLILSDRKELNKPIVKTCLIIFLFLLYGATIVSLFMPLIVTIKKIN